MHTLTLRLIGIITIACLGNGNYDCNYTPYKLQAFVANGLTRHHPCGKQASVATPVHQAFIRVETTPLFGTFWQGEELDCDDAPICRLFPLHQGDVIEIDGISNGSQLDQQFDPSKQYKWKEIYEDSGMRPPVLRAPADATIHSLGSLVIAAGTWTQEPYGDDDIMITRGTFKTTAPDITISIKGTNKKIKVPTDATVDIINFPPAHVFGNTAMHVDHPNKRHFFLHYTLANPEPDDCLSPLLDQNVPFMTKIKRFLKGGDLVGSLACSNSNYP